MKKIFVIVLIGLLCFGCTAAKPEENNVTEAQQFKEEYESYNGQKNPENNKAYLNVDLPADSPIHYGTYEEVFSVLDSTGVIYLGYPTCPWCRNAIGVLLDACLENEIDQIVYLNNKEDRNQLSLENGEIVTEEKGSEQYLKLLEKLGDTAEIYDGLEDESIHRIYFPTVIVVKNGEVVLYHTSTVQSQEDPYIGLTDAQYEELKGIYSTGLKKLKVKGCSVEKKC